MFIYCFVKVITTSMKETSYDDFFLITIYSDFKFKVLIKHGLN